jgi:hypothetical protein
MVLQEFLELQLQTQQVAHQAPAEQMVLQEFLELQLQVR